MQPTTQMAPSTHTLEREQRRSDRARRPAAHRSRRRGRGLRRRRDAHLSRRRHVLARAARDLRRVLAAQNETLPLMRAAHRFVEIHERAQEVTRPSARPADARRLRSAADLRARHGVHQRAGRLREKRRRPREHRVRELPAAEPQATRAALDRYDGIDVRIEDAC
jgi:hypothetical protein